MSTRKPWGLKPVVVVVASAATVLVVAACGNGAVVTDGSPVTIGVLQGSTGDLLSYVAAKEGIYEKRGVDVELLDMSLGNTIATSVISNDVTVGGMATGLLWPAIAKGACVQALGATEGNTTDMVAQPGTQITGDPTDPSTTLQSIKGKTIGVSARGAGLELWFNKLFTDAGMDPTKDITYVAVGGPATAIQAFEAKQVDVLYYFPTMASELPSSDFVRVTDTVGRSDNSLSTLIKGYFSATCDTVEQRPNDVLNFCKALWDTYDFAQDPKNAAVMGTRLAELTGVSEDAGPAAWEALKDTYMSPTITQDQWEAQAVFTGSPALSVPDFDSAVYAPCAGSDPR